MLSARGYNYLFATVKCLDDIKCIITCFITLIIMT